MLRRARDISTSFALSVSRSISSHQALAGSRTWTLRAYVEIPLHGVTRRLTNHTESYGRPEIIINLYATSSTEGNALSSIDFTLRPFPNSLSSHLKPIYYLLQSLLRTNVSRPQSLSMRKRSHGDMLDLSQTSSGRKRFEVDDPTSFARKRVQVYLNRYMRTCASYNRYITAGDCYNMQLEERTTTRSSWSWR